VIVLPPLLLCGVCRIFASLLPFFSPFSGATALRVILPPPLPPFPEEIIPRRGRRSLGPARRSSFSFLPPSWHGATRGRRRVFLPLVEPSPRDKLPPSPFSSPLPYPAKSRDEAREVPFIVFPPLSPPADQADIGTRSAVRVPVFFSLLLPGR